MIPSPHCEDCGKKWPGKKGGGYRYGVCPCCTVRWSEAMRAYEATSRGRRMVDRLDADQCMWVLKKLTEWHQMGASYDGANQDRLRSIRVHARRVLERLNEVDRGST